MRRLAWSLLLTLGDGRAGPRRGRPRSGPRATVRRSRPTWARARSPTGNAAWDGRSVRLFGARNEVLAFQVIVQADAAGIGALGVSLPELRQRGGAARIVYAPPAADPSSVGRAADPALLGALMQVTQETHAAWVWEPGSAAAPKRTVGWQPVQLVPENARAGRGGFPLRVAPGTAQAVWIEVYTGRGRPAGAYEGTISVRGRRAAALAPGCAVAPRLRAAGRELHGRDGVLRAGAARALPGPQPRRGLPPLRAPPARRARARVRRGAGPREPRPAEGRRLHRGEPATRAPARATATASSRSRSTGPGRTSTSARARGGARTRG